MNVGLIRPCQMGTKEAIVTWKKVTEHCGLLGKLLLGDLVLADRGFDIADSCGLYGARLKIPAFTKGRPEWSPLDIESTGKIANVISQFNEKFSCHHCKWA